jgi:hypothetical protein
MARRSIGARGRNGHPLHAGSVLAEAAGAVQHDLVGVGAEPQALRESVDRAFQPAIVERDQPTADVTQEVVVVVSRRIDSFVAHDAVAKLQPGDQPLIDQQLEDPVDARARDRSVTGAQPFLNVKRADRALLGAEQVDHRLTSPRAPVPGLGQDGPSML